MKFSCTHCKVDMKVQMIGVLLIETYTPSQLPYKMYQADVLECPICGHEFVFTDARPRHLTQETPDQIKQAISSFQETGKKVYVSHEHPAGNDFELLFGIKAKP